MKIIKKEVILILLIFLLYGVFAFELKRLKRIPVLKKSRTILQAQKYNVVIENEGKEHTLQVSSNYNILDAALDAGLELTHDCKLGVCLTCPAKLLSGKVDQSEGTLDQSVIDQGYTLMCIAKPQSDVRIKIIAEDELINAQFKRPS